MQSIDTCVDYLAELGLVEVTEEPASLPPGAVYERLAAAGDPVPLDVAVAALGAGMDISHIEGYQLETLTDE